MSPITLVVPVYNEVGTLPALLEGLKTVCSDCQVIIVDDGSTDGSRALLEWSHGFLLLSNRMGKGKGACIRTALPHAQGKVLLIVDADLEYDLREIPAVVEPVLNGGYAACYGNRFHSGFPAGMALPNRWINRLLVWLVKRLYGCRLGDEATCFKAVNLEVLRGLELVCQRFEFCPEVTAKLLRAGLDIAEVDLHLYRPRGYAEGKKVRWTDGLEAVWTLFRWRSWEPPHRLLSLIREQDFRRAQRLARGISGSSCS